MVRKVQLYNKACMRAEQVTANNYFFPKSVLERALGKTVPLCINFDMEKVVGFAKPTKLVGGDLFCYAEVTNADLVKRVIDYRSLFGRDFGYQLRTSFLCHSSKLVEGMKYIQEAELVSICLALNIDDYVVEEDVVL